MKKENKSKELLIAIYKRRVLLLEICCALFVALAVYFLFVADYSQAPEEEPKAADDFSAADENSSDGVLPEDGNGTSSFSLDDEIAKIIEQEEQNHFGPLPEEEQKTSEPAKKVSEKRALRGEKKYIVVVIDDMGINHPLSEEMIEIKSPITLSFLTYGENLKGFVDQARKAGHEVIIHIPMEPYAAANTAPQQLNVSMNKEEIKSTLISLLNNIDHLDGGNNHMGSKFTENKEKMSAVMGVLKERKMFFLDSKTSAKAIGCEVAEKYGVECVSRDVFLDNENDFEYITNQFKQLEKVAEKKGYAIAIGHPKSETVKALRKWLKNLDSSEFEIISLNELLKKFKK